MNALLKRTSQKSHASEELCYLIELMQAEFLKLHSTKANAEVRVQTLETDLVVMKGEEDAKYTRLRMQT